MTTENEMIIDKTGNVVLQGVTVDGEFKEILVNESGTLAVEGLTDGLVVISHGTNEIHKGNHYYIKGTEEVDGLGTTLDFLFKTGDTTPHTKRSFSAEQDFMVDVYEGATVSVNGTAVTPINNNRDSAKVSTIEAYREPTITDLGTEIRPSRVGSGVFRGSGGDGGMADEYLGKKNTNYIFRFTKMDTGEHRVDFYISRLEQNI